MLRILTREWVIGSAVIALAVTAGCQRHAGGPPAADRTGSNTTDFGRKQGDSTALMEVTLEVTGMS